jgi:hypothetical protein
MLNQSHPNSVVTVMLPQHRSPGIFGWLVAFVVVLLLVLFAVVARSSPVDPSGDVALVNGKVYPTPQAAPILDAVVLIHGPATFFKAGKTGEVLRGYDADLGGSRRRSGHRHSQLRQGGVHHSRGKR